MDHPPPPLPTDEDLARSHLRGDPDAFERLVERYATPIYRHAYRLSGLHEDAQDLAQETFVRVFQHLGRIDLGRPLKPWIYRICTNLCRNHAARKKSLLFSHLADDEDDTPQDIADTFESPESGPQEELVRTEDIQAVRTALAALPHKYRVILELCYFDQLSYEEIADALDLPLNTVRTRLRRAKQQLAKAIAPPNHFL
jgi:RNA polymerase sigma-70 factor (ECF subfamily)